MAYSNIAWSMYGQLQSKINTEIVKCEIENKYYLPTEVDETEFMGKFSFGIVLHLNADVEIAEETGASDYNVRWYQWTAKAFLNDSEERQKTIFDFAEHIKYALQQNKVNSTYWQSIRNINIEYPQPEAQSNVKIALITFEVMYAG